MAALSDHLVSPTDESQLTFASLTPADKRTFDAMQTVIDTCSDDASHHKLFFRRGAGALTATRSPIIPPDPFDLSSGFTTEADRSDDEDYAATEAAACYLLSLGTAAQPIQPEVGFWFGTGDLDRFGKNAGVDILLPPTNTADSLRSSTALGNSVYPRQGYFAFDRNYAQLWLHARHKGIRVDDRPLAQRSKVLLEKRTRICIGPYRYIFEFKVADEERFQVAKRQYLAAYGLGTEPHESTSVTPSASDVCVQGWRLHGIVGSSPVSVIHAATNVRSGEVVAVKRMRFGSSKGSAEEEVRLYCQMLESIKNHRYRSFVMQKHSVLQNDRPYAAVHEVYLLWKPLARGDFSQFGLSGQWHTQTKAVKKKLYVQILLGLMALHDCNWIHRDLKPANLGVVDLGERPLAVIMDEGQAIRQAREGHVPRVAHCGTIGYLAPELENSTFAPTYDNKVDIWSMGAIAYFLFITGRIPWSLRFNMFVPAREAQGHSLHIFHEARAGLASQPVETFEHLIGQMLDEKPQRRPSVQKILMHPAIQSVRDEIDKDAEIWTSSGQKRSLS